MLQHNPAIQKQAARLLILGVFLFFLGLAAGFFIPIMANPRMGLTTHLEGIMNGMFLIILGLIWNKVQLEQKWLNFTFWLVLYGSFANYLAVLLAAITGAGKMMPLAGGAEGSAFLEAVISFLLISLSLVMLAVCIFVLRGLMTYLQDIKA